MNHPLQVERLGSGPRVVFIHGSMSNGADAWHAQRALADRFAVEIVDRRGFGASPDPDGRVDFERDADDIVALLGEDGAHVVGHSYGGVVGLLVAGQAPGRVRSLTVIEPPAFAVIPDHPASIALRERLAPLFPAPDGMRPAAWVGSFARALGFPGPDPDLSPAAERDVWTSMRERAVWEAAIPLGSIRAAGIPALVVRGGWLPVPSAAEVGGAFFAAVCDRLVEALDAESAAIPDTFHRPQASGAPFNHRLAAFIARTDAATRGDERRDP